VGWRGRDDVRGDRGERPGGVRDAQEEQARLPLPPVCVCVRACVRVFCVCVCVSGKKYKLLLPPVCVRACVCVGQEEQARLPCVCVCVCVRACRARRTSSATATPGAPQYTTADGLLRAVSKGAVLCAGRETRKAEYNNNQDSVDEGGGSRSWTGSQAGRKGLACSERFGP
jgi:hypothetical protein